MSTSQALSITAKTFRGYRRFRVFIRELSATFLGLFLCSFALHSAANDIELISQAFDAPLVGDWANGTSSEPAVSDDGRFVAYVSSASDLAEDDPDVNRRIQDIFFYDIAAGETTLLTRFANGGSSAPDVSADGRYVAVSYTHLTLPTTPYV